MLLSFSAHSPFVLIGLCIQFLVPLILVTPLPPGGLRRLVPGVNLRAPILLRRLMPGTVDLTSSLGQQAALMQVLIVVVLPVNISPMPTTAMAPIVQYVSTMQDWRQQIGTETEFSRRTDYIVVNLTRVLKEQARGRAHGVMIESRAA